MRKFLFILLLAVAASAAAQDFKTEYDKLVIENSKLKERVSSLEKDSSELALAKEKINQLCSDTAFANNIRINLQGQNARAAAELDSIKSSSEYKMWVKNKKPMKVLEKHIQSLQTDSVAKKQTIEEKDKMIRKTEQERNTARNLNKSVIDALDNKYKQSVDALFKSCSLSELNFDKQLYQKLGKTDNIGKINQVIACIEVSALTGEKYNSAKVNSMLSRLPQNAAIGKQLTSRLQNYAKANSEASALWKTIAKDVMAEPIDNESFPQIQAKRQIWQRVQTFLNAHPKLADEYPFVYKQLQDMMLKVWDNANNFTSLPNPFE